MEMEGRRGRERRVRVRAEEGERGRRRGIEKGGRRDRERGKATLYMFDKLYF